MAEDKAPEPASPAAYWRHASDRLRENARVFVASLGAVALTVITGLSLTGLSTLNPRSPSFWFALAGALVAIVSVVLMLGLVVKLASASAVSVSDLLDSGSTGKQGRGTGDKYAARIIGTESNAYLAGHKNLDEFSKNVSQAISEERLALQAAVEAPADLVANRALKAAGIKRAWYEAQLGAAMEAASYQRLQWNYRRTGNQLVIAGAFAGLGILTYAAAMHPLGLPTSPVAVTTHDSIQVNVPAEAAAAALYEEVLGCTESVQALVTGKGESSTVSAITVPDSGCRSVTINAVWDGDGYVADFSLPDETETDSAEQS